MKRLVLKNKGKKILGLCAGIADYVDVDVTVIRLIVLTVIIMTGVLPRTVRLPDRISYYPERRRIKPNA